MAPTTSWKSLLRQCELGPKQTSERAQALGSPLSRTKKKENLSIRQHSISSVSENGSKAANDHPFFLNGLQAKSMKSMTKRQHTIPSVSENVYEVGNNHQLFKL